MGRAPKQAATEDPAEDVPEPVAIPQEQVRVMGGAIVRTVEIRGVFPAIPEGEETVEIITTAPGTLDVGGIIPVGSRGVIARRQYSRAWMQPATAKDARKVGQ